MQLPLPYSLFGKQSARRAPWLLGATLGLCLGAAAPAAAQTVYGLSPAGLVTFNAADPATVSAPVPVMGITAGQVLVGLDVRPNTGELFALGYDATAGQAQLYIINPTSGTATSPGPAIALALGSATDRIGFDFNPTVDRIRVVSTNRANFRLNPTNGALAFTDGTLTYAAPADGSTAPTPGVGAVAYTNSYIGTGSTTLYGIDELNSRLVLQNPPNAGTLNPVGADGALGLTTSALTQSTDIDIYFDPATSQNQAYLIANSTADPASNQLYALNLTTGVASAPVAIGSGALGITDIAVAIDRALPALTGQLVYATQTVGPNTNLLSFDSATPNVIRSLVTITGLTTGQALVGIDARPRTAQMYGLGYDATKMTDNASLYTINTTTGAATLVSSTAMTLALGGTSDRVGFDFNPRVDLIRVVSTNRANYRLNPVTATVEDGNATTAGVQGDEDLNTTALGVTTPSIAAAAYSNNFVGTGSTTLFVFDNVVNQAFVQSPPNAGTLSAVGLVAGITVNQNVGIGFDIYSIRSGENLALLAAALGESTNAQLYEINISNGSATPYGTNNTIGYGVPVNSIAFSRFAVDPNPPVNINGQTLFALTGGNLISFDSGNPRVIRTSTVLMGLVPGQTLVGLDSRPANGDLYALGYDAAAVAPAPNTQLYRVNTATGALTTVGNALSLPLGTADARIGFDFNPAVDRIRVVSTNQANIRLNPNDGTLVQTDGPLTLTTGTPSISAVAYTNSSPGPFPSTSTTTLYDYDVASNQLFRQEPPNAGGLVSVGSSGITVNPEASVDFDIFFDASATGDTQNKAFLAASEGTSSNANLYTVNLTSGAATRVEVIGSGLPISGLTAQIASTVLSTNRASGKLSAQVDLFPNPATGEVSVTLPAALIKQSVEATLVNTLGQPVLRRTLSARDGSTQRLSLNGVAKGVYMLQLSTAEGVVSKRLMVR